MDKSVLQSQLDQIKWVDSVNNHRDMCGEYPYCAYCDKMVQYPCATAYLKLGGKPVLRRTSKPLVRETNAEITDLKSSLGKRFNYDKVMNKKANRKSLTFAEKFALSDDIIKERYAILQAKLTESTSKGAKIKSRISKQCDTYRRDGEVVAKITIIGTSLRINLPLDPNAAEFNDGKTPHTDTSNKRVYEEVPFQFKVNSKLALKRALSLIDLIK
ncbi:MAG: hypothetical protein MJ068_03510 [Clostridia bacterium]|nr:hypothetical protein [Clostridia bacterium]